MPDRESSAKEKERAAFIEEIPVGTFVINIGVHNAIDLRHQLAQTAGGEIYDDPSSIFVNVEDVDGTGRKDIWDFHYLQRVTLRPEEEEFPIVEL